MSLIHALKHPVGDIWCPANIKSTGGVANADIAQVTCGHCLHILHNQSRDQEIAAHKRAIELSGGIIHAPEGGHKNFTWCEKGVAPGCQLWTETNCLDCLDAGTKAGYSLMAKYAAELRAKNKVVAQFTNKCPRCGAAAYVGFTMVECSKGCK